MDEPTPRNLIPIVVLFTASILFTMTTVGLVSALLVDLANAFDTTVAITGQLITTQAIAWALASTIVGPISDRIGRKRVLVTGLIIAGAGMLCYSFAWDYSILVVSSVLAGMGGALTAPTILSSVGDYAPRNKLGRIMAMVGAGVPLAYIIGAPGGAWIADHLGWQSSFLILGLLLLLTAILCFFIHPSQKTRPSTGSSTYLSSFKTAFQQKALLALLIGNIMAGCSYSTIYSYLAAFLIQSYSLSLGQVAPLISYIAIPQLLGNFLGGAMADRFNRNNICAVTQFLVGATAIALTLMTGNIWLSVVLAAFFSGVFSANRPVLAVIIVSLSSTLRGTMTGIMAASNQIGRALGTMIGGLVLGLAGYSYLGGVSFIFSIVGAILFFYARPGSSQVPQE